MRKEVQINGKWYWTLEATDQNQAFNPPEPCYVWDGDDYQKRNKNLFAIKAKVNNAPSFFTDVGTRWLYCALLSSEHEKKSRRCTTLELAKWCDQNGFWINAEGVAVTKTSFFYETRNDECDGNLISICTWDGEPMEPTAKNMGLPE